MKFKSYLLLGFAAVAFAACNEDFDDWTQQTANEQPETVSFGGGSVSEVSLIDFAAIPDNQDSVKICNITAPTSTYTVTENKYTIKLTGTKKDGTQVHQTLDIDSEGRVLYKDFVTFVESVFGKNPNNTNVMDGEVTAYTGDGKTAVKSVLAVSGTFNVKVKVKAPFIDPAGYYIVGNVDGWQCKKIVEYHLVNNGGDVYENPVFTLTIPNDPVKFKDITTFEIKLIPEAAFAPDGSIANWSIALSALPGVSEPSYKGNFAWDNSGDNIRFKADANAVFYTFTFNLLEGTYEVTALSFNPFVFYIGATDGWSNAEQRLALTDDSGIYTGYLYCADPNGWGNEFKFQKVAGDWGTEINSGHLTGGITGDFADGGGNIKATAGEGIYYVTLNMGNMSLNAVRITNMNLVGQFNGWNPSDDAQQMTWNATDFCYEITGAGVTADGWKFTANNAWSVANLGGSIDNLVYDGGNLSAVGTTIKLYPTRKTADNIYCTVE